MFFFFISSLWITYAWFHNYSWFTSFFFVKPPLHRLAKLYWFQLLVSELDFSIKLHLHRGPAKNSSAYVPPLRFQFADFHFILHTEVSYIISQPCPKFFQGVKDFSIPIGLDAKVKVDLVVVGSVAVSEKGSCSRFFTHLDIFMAISWFHILLICTS